MIRDWPLATRWMSAMDRGIQNGRLTVWTFDNQRTRTAAVEIQSDVPAVVQDDLRQLRQSDPFAVVWLPAIHYNEQ